MTPTPFARICHDPICHICQNGALTPKPAHTIGPLDSAQRLDCGIAPTQDSTPLKAPALAHCWDRQIDDGVVNDAAKVAQREQMKVTRVSEVIRLWRHGAWKKQSGLEMAAARRRLHKTV